jgi:hypothetical protein
MTWGSSMWLMLCILAPQRPQTRSRSKTRLWQERGWLDSPPTYPGSAENFPGLVPDILQTDALAWSPRPAVHPQARQNLVCRR